MEMLSFLPPAAMCSNTFFHYSMLWSHRLFSPTFQIFIKKAEWTSAPSNPPPVAIPQTPIDRSAEQNGAFAAAAEIFPGSLQMSFPHSGPRVPLAGEILPPQGWFVWEMRLRMRRPIPTRWQTDWELLPRCAWNARRDTQKLYTDDAVFSKKKRMK